jgi:hypothetical protein
VTQEWKLDANQLIFAYMHELELIGALEGDIHGFRLIRDWTDEEHNHALASVRARDSYYLVEKEEGYRPSGLKPITNAGWQAIRQLIRDAGCNDRPIFQYPARFRP